MAGPVPYGSWAAKSLYFALRVNPANSQFVYPSHMDISKMLAELRAELENLEQAIVVLERLVVGRGRRRGRPPAWMTAVKRRGRPPGSKNKRKATS